MSCCVCWTCVPQGTIQVIQQRGKFQKFADPGCHWVIPCVCQEVAGALSTRVQALDVAVETKTKDNVFVTIIVSTQYMVLRESSRMYDAFYKLTDSREQIRSYIFDVVRSTVPRINLDDVFTTKEEIATWKPGEVLLLNGKLLTGRDAAHKRMVDMLNKGEALPVDLRGKFIY